jgi:hypothetical protein
LALDIPPAAVTRRKPTPFRTAAARVFGAVLAFLSLWQVLSPVNRADVMLGLGGLVVSALWFAHVPRNVRIGATVALIVWIGLRLAA